MTTEAAFIAALRAIATSPAARGLADDAAMLQLGETRLVLTMDTIVEGVHFLPDDPAETVAWKLVATNVSDLSAKGAEPRGCLLSYPLAQEDGWDTAFLAGLATACEHFAIPLLGGDTVRQPPGAARSFALVALGEPHDGVPVPSRAGASAGDHLWVSGPIGDAGAGLAILRGERDADVASRANLISAYRQPQPCAPLGVAIAPLVSAMMDVSDGLLIDAKRLAAASRLAVEIDLSQVPLSPAFCQVMGEALEARLFASTAGDDYHLLFAAPAEQEHSLSALPAKHGRSFYRVGRLAVGQGLQLTYDDQAVPAPASLGYEHQN
ncbi:thiamine-phosphate kinase [Novosphingobium sp. 9U]|uniref:thiamine-phosphate kinase n=1 Tax=Novosphingobium sp. 9U TaxID=2653158 RepID=UPI0012F0CABC|nr:thiamine-phosphate kinase [Novosphingobium sp. 9U]VWX51408.1 Thiamine-monophosphate kinase [Novosphingobium sp. 9U]